MSDRIKEKINLNKVAYSVRATQAVLQYGVGAMVDFPDQTLVTAAPETWTRTSKIYDDRFAKALNVDYFAMPLDVSYTRFPEWYFCPKCRKFQPIKQWIKEYQENASSKMLEKDKYMTKSLKCQKCHQDLVPSRIVTVCESGHLNDFPWIEWVHVKSNKKICAKPHLKFKTGASSTEGLEGLIVSCDCNASATLKGAFDKDAFEKLDEKAGTEDFICQGNHPYKNERCLCGCYPKTVQRGASSVYFPLTFNSLVIPPYSEKLNSRIEQSKAYEDCIVVISDEEFTEEERDRKKEFIRKKLPRWTKKIALEIGAPVSDVERVLLRKWIDENEIVNVTSLKYKMQEYEALTGEVQLTENSGDFSREEMNIQDYQLPHVNQISLIDKVRVVKAFVGFSRLKPAMTMDDKGVVIIKDKNTNWYPACEVRGEGIFIEFDNDSIEDWVSNNPEVEERVNIIQNNYDRSFMGTNHPRKITAKFVMLHTLAHLLIKQLSFECGYSIASLSERIYCSDEIDGRIMSGIFIYTASGDSEGTLGGLVRQGRSDAFPRILKKAVSEAKVCSNDPVCILSRGQGNESLNLSACYACGLLPETSCEENNVLLDRALIVGTYINKDMGFWKELL